MNDKYKTTKVSIVIIILSLLAVFAISIIIPEITGAGEVIIGQQAVENFRSGLRIQFTKDNGTIIAAFDMTQTDDDGMLFGGSIDIDHLDFENIDFQFLDNYDIQQSYVDINNNTLVLLP